MQKIFAVLIFNILLFLANETNAEQDYCGTQDETCFFAKCCDGYECVGLFPKKCDLESDVTTPGEIPPKDDETSKLPDRKKDELTESPQSTTSKPDEVKYTTIKFVTQEYLISHYPESINETLVASTYTVLPDNRTVNLQSTGSTAKTVEKDKFHQQNHSSPTSSALTLSTFYYILYLSFVTSMLSLL